MVLVVDSWECFLEHLEGSRGIGLYQLIDTGVGVLLRVRGGTLGYEHEFPDEEDKDLIRKVRMLEARGCMRVTKIVDDTAWFL